MVRDRHRSRLVSRVADFSVLPPPSSRGPLQMEALIYFLSYYDKQQMTQARTKWYQQRVAKISIIIEAEV